MPHQMGGSSKLLIYFHANAEDLGTSYQFLNYLRQILRINIIAPEYPGYGIYQKTKIGTQ